MRKDYPDEFKLKTILHNLKKDWEVTSIGCMIKKNIWHPPLPTREVFAKMSKNQKK